MPVRIRRGGKRLTQILLQELTTSALRRKSRSLPFPRSTLHLITESQMKLLTWQLNMLHNLPTSSHQKMSHVNQASLTHHKSQCFCSVISQRPECCLSSWLSSQHELTEILPPHNCTRATQCSAEGTEDKTFRIFKNF